jgi:hypothetical protein
MAGNSGRTLTVYLAADTKQATQGIDSFTKNLAKIGGVVAGAFTIDAIANFASEAINAGSALNESMSKVGVVFGQNAKEITTWSKDSATAFGMSQQAALEAAGTYGNLFQAFGLGQAESAKMSKSLVQLAGDLASFNNVPVADALDALRSGLSGETEPLKRFGVALTDARLKSEALTLGIYDGKGALDAAQKSQAAYALILKDTRLAQGDYARTSDGFANTMRTLGAEVDNAKATIGTALVKAIQDAAQALGGPTGLATMIETTAQKTANLVTGISQVVTQILTLAKTVNDASQKDDLWGTLTLNLRNMADTLANQVIPGFSQARTALDGFMAVGQAATLVEQQKADSIAASEALYAGYIATLDANSAAQQANAREAYNTAAAADTEAAAMKRLKGDVDNLNSVFSGTAAMDGWKESLANIDKEIAKVSRSLSDNTETGRTNRAEVMSLYTDAAAAAESWGKSHGKNAAWIEQRTAAMFAANRAALIAKGFKPEDIDAFLGGQSTWVQRLTLIGQGLTNGQAVVAMRYAGLAAGSAIVQGMVAGMDAGTKPVATAADRLANTAKIHAMQRLESHSPSKVFYRIGKDIGNGMALGILASQAAVKAATTLTLQALGDEVMTKFTEQINAAKDDLKAAQDAYWDFAKSTKQSLLGNIGLGEAITQDTGKEGSKPWLDFFRTQVGTASQWAKKLAEYARDPSISDALVTELAKLSPDAGLRFAADFTPALASQLNSDLAQLDLFAGEAGIAFADRFKQQGILDAQAHLTALVDESAKQYQALYDMGYRMGDAVAAGYRAAVASIPGYSAPAGNGAGTYKPIYDKGPSTPAVVNNVTVNAGVGDPIAIAKTVQNAILKAAMRVGGN